MTAKEVLSQLEAFGDEKRYKWNTKRGVVGKQFGVKMGDIRKIAKKIKKDHTLAMELWTSEIYEARSLACLIMDVEELSSIELEHLVASMQNTWVSDWMNSYVIKLHKDRDSFRESWMQSDNGMIARAGWNLTAIKANRKSEDLAYPALIDRLEFEMPKADELAQWTMNFTLAYIGINFPEHRERVVLVGEKLGLYKEFPTAKGCTSPYVPTWVDAMVKKGA